MSPQSEKVGGHVPRVPHQIAPMVVLIIKLRCKNGFTYFIIRICISLSEFNHLPHSSDVVETVSSETETKTWKFETETSHFSDSN